MSSIRCSNCGLVNFASAQMCKRCQQPLNSLAPVAAQRTYQSPPPNFQLFQTPPPPPNFEKGFAPSQIRQQPICCLKCGERNGVSIKEFKKDYVPSVCYLMAFVGLLPMLILIAVLRVTHRLSAPFCENCWKKFSWVTPIEWLTALGFFALIIGGIIAVIALESGFAFFLFFVVAIGLIIWGQIYKSRNSPKYKKLDKEIAIIESKFLGEIAFGR